jgi:N-carbamoylputrescine amidase
MRLGLIQMRCDGDRATNHARAAERVAEAARQGCALVALPELFAGRYFPQEMAERHYDLAEPVPGPTFELLRGLAARHHLVLVGSLYERAMEGLYYNTAMVFDETGALAGKARKMHIPDGPQYCEKYYFTPGDTGYPVFPTCAGALAVPTCWDQWFPEVARIVALEGAQCIVYPTAIGSEPEHPGLSTRDAWETVIRSHAIANGVFTAAVNRVGVEDAMTFYGGSFVADPLGRVLARADADEALVVADLDLDLIRRTRQMLQMLRDRRPDTYGRLLSR